MAATDVTISGILYDKLRRTVQHVVLVGEMNPTGAQIGGGPIIPPDQPGGPVDPGYGVPEKPSWPGNVPPVWGGRPVYPGHELPPVQPLPPNVEAPPPGSPPQIVQGTQPVQPIVPPPAVVIEYPGIGKVVVPQPVPATPPA